MSRYSAPTFDYQCRTDNCEVENEFQIDPACSGSWDEPPSGGYADPTVDNCPGCGADLTDEKYLEKVYEAWCDSQERDYDDRDDY